jgi:phospholipid:diacylglycerol acyltransferase
MSLIPRGGDTIWGTLDWSPEEGSVCPSGKEESDHSKGINYGRMISFGRDVAEAPASDIDQIDFRVSYVSYICIPCLFLNTENSHYWFRQLG